MGRRFVQEQDPYLAWRDALERANRHLRSSEVLMAIGLNEVEAQLRERTAFGWTPVPEIVDNQRRRRSGLCRHVPAYSYRHYYSYQAPRRGKETRSWATAQDFLRDVRILGRWTTEPLVLFLVSAFEIFIRQWCFAEGQERLRRMVALGRRELSSLIWNLRSLPRYTPTLGVVADAFPDIGCKLRKSACQRPETGMSTSIDAFRGAELWREVRNLLVHHHGRIHQDFVKQGGYGQLWEQIHRESSMQRRSSARLGLVAGKHLSLSRQDFVLAASMCSRAADLIDECSSYAPLSWRIVEKV